MTVYVGPSSALTEALVGARPLSHRFHDVQHQVMPAIFGINAKVTIGPSNQLRQPISSHVDPIVDIINETCNVTHEYDRAGWPNYAGRLKVTISGIGKSNFVCSQDVGETFDSAETPAIIDSCNARP